LELGGGGISTLMIYAHLLVKGVSGGLNWDHCTLNHPKINAAPKKWMKYGAGGHNCSVALDLRKIEHVVGEGATVFPNTTGQR
jgi:hypothetical protein